MLPGCESELWVAVCGSAMCSPHRLVVRTSRCGRDNPGSTPGADIACANVSVDELANINMLSKSRARFLSGPFVCALHRILTLFPHISCWLVGSRIIVPVLFAFLLRLSSFWILFSARFVFHHMLPSLSHSVLLSAPPPCLRPRCCSCFGRIRN